MKRTLIILLALTVFAATPCTAQIPMDVFLIGGQSNALGEGDSSQSPVTVAGTVKQYFGGSVTNANDPVGGASTGSAWPSFGAAYHAATGRIVGLIPVAVPGSAQLAISQAEEHWDVGGGLVPAALTARDDAMLAFAAAGYDPVFRGVLWSQGEADAAAMVLHPSSVTVVDYMTAFVNMINRFRATPYEKTAFFVIGTGVGTGSWSSSTPYMAQVKSAQQFVADSDSRVRVVFYGASEFPQRSLMSDEVHYSQRGYNEVGSAAASAVALSGLASPITAGPDR